MRKLHFAGAACALWALGIIAAGCGGDNGGNPTGYFPEGQAGQNAYLFTIPISPIPDDSSTVFLFANILAPPPTDGFRVYINPGGEGFRSATDTAVPPVSTTGVGYNSYFTLVEGYNPLDGAEVVARGSRGGLETSYAPVTNVSTVSAGLPVELLRRTPVVLLSPPDSVVGGVPTIHPVLTWQPLPAASYILTVTLTTGQPVYVVHTTATTHAVGLSPGVVFENQPLRDGGLYNWTVQAFDGGYRLFGFSPSPNAFFVNVPDVP